MPRTTTADDGIRTKLQETETQIGAARDDLAAATRALNDAKSRFAASSAPLSANSPEMRRVKAARERHDSARARLDDLGATQVELLKALGQDPSRTRSGPARLDATTPGSWASAVVSHHHLGQPMAALTTDELGSTDATDRAFFVRLERTSSLMAGVPVIDIDTTSIKVGQITGDVAPVEPVAETDPIPKSDPPITDREIAPPKFPRLTTMSKEAADDASPTRLAVIERQLIQAIGVGFDAAAFHGAPGSLHPGLENTAGITSVAVDVGDTAYDWAADAAGSLLAVSGTPALLFLNPFTVRSLLKLKDDNGAYRIETLQDAASDLMGVTVRISRGVEDGHAFMVDPSCLAIVRRSDVETIWYPGYDPDHMLVALLAVMRAQLVTTDPRGVVHVTGLPVPTP